MIISPYTHLIVPRQYFLNESTLTDLLEPRDYVFVYHDCNSNIHLKLEHLISNTYSFLLYKDLTTKDSHSILDKLCFIKGMEYRIKEDCLYIELITIDNLNTFMYIMSDVFHKSFRFYGWVKG